MRKVLTFKVKLQAEFYDYKHRRPKDAAILLCRDINQVLAKYDGSLGGAQIVNVPEKLDVKTVVED